MPTTPPLSDSEPARIIIPLKANNPVTQFTNNLLFGPEPLKPLDKIQRIKTFIPNEPSVRLDEQAIELIEIQSFSDSLTHAQKNWGKLPGMLTKSLSDTARFEFQKAYQEAAFGNATDSEKVALAIKELNVNAFKETSLASNFRRLDAHFLCESSEHRFLIC